VDYRKLNSVTIQDAYPVPWIDESLNALAGSKYFSTLNLLSGYWQSGCPRESGVHYQGRIVEVEGAPLWVDFRSRYVPEAYGTSPQWIPLENTVGIPQ